MNKSIRGKNKSTIYSKKEYDLHLICKVLLQKKILEAGHNAATEVPLVSRILGITKIADVVDDTSRVFYEVERHPTKDWRAQVDAVASELNCVGFVVNLEDIPPHIVSAIEDLGKILSSMVVK